MRHKKREARNSVCALKFRKHFVRNKLGFYIYMLWTYPPSPEPSRLSGWCSVQVGRDPGSYVATSKRLGVLKPAKALLLAVSRKSRKFYTTFFWTGFSSRAFSYLVRAMLISFYRIRQSLISCVRDQISDHQYISNYITLT